MTIILNGPSSSGKTMLRDHFASMSKDLFIKMGIDLWWGQFFPKQYIMFNKKAHMGLQLIHGENGIDTFIGPYGWSLIYAYMDFMKDISNRGMNIIADDVILTKDDIAKYFVLDLSQTFLIGIYCDESEVLRREKMRGDRMIGTASGQFSSIHQFAAYYDFIVDNTTASESNAFKIMEFVKHNMPTGLLNLFRDMNANPNFSDITCGDC